MTTLDLLEAVKWNEDGETAWGDKISFPTRDAFIEGALHVQIDEFDCDLDEIVWRLQLQGVNIPDYPWQQGFSEVLYKALRRRTRTVHMRKVDDSEEPWQECGPHATGAEPHWRLDLP